MNEVTWIDSEVIAKPVGKADAKISGVKELTNAEAAKIVDEEFKKEGKNAA